MAANLLGTDLEAKLAMRRPRVMVGAIVCVIGSLLCGNVVVAQWNNPYPAASASRSILYSVFQERPKHLDPVSSYSENEAIFTGQVYEPVVQYHFLRRPYQLVPLTAESVPVPEYYDRNGQRLPDTAEETLIAKTVYRIHLKPGILYAPHPALARGPDGTYLYHRLTPADLGHIATLDDFHATGTRELIAADYVYQIKRLANPFLYSPVLSFLGRYIVGLSDLSERLKDQFHGGPQFIDLRNFDLPGARVIDRYTFEIELQAKYPQFVYWLAMSFFAPIPWEADAFYSQPGMAERNLTLDWFPLGTGPYLLAENNPNRRMVLKRNPNFRGERYPADGEPSDRMQGLLASAGAAMPFIDEAHFMLEREDIPEWNKFLQGYYDSSAIAPDGFDQAVRFGPDGTPELTDLMRERGVHLAVATQPAISYVGFNMLDPVVGGDAEPQRLLRRAIAIAVDIEEMISIFSNGRGTAAQGPIPPGIFGFRDGQDGTNRYVYDWVAAHPRRKSIGEAKALLAAAGFPGGVDPTTGVPLVLHFDATTTGPDMKAMFNWYRKQFAKLGIQLIVRSTDYNRFQEKMDKGEAQIFSWGWNADYPDPENFLFLLYGPNGKVEHRGENAANYHNKTFDALFVKMRAMENGPERQRIIDEMIEIARADGPWLWGFHPQAFALYQRWVGNVKPNMMARNTLKYWKIDQRLRADSWQRWNRPRLWPLLVGGGLLVVAIIPAMLAGRRRRRTLAGP